MAPPRVSQQPKQQTQPTTGLNNNSYQISRALYHNPRAGHGLTETCGFVKADFMKMPFEDAAYDAVYEIDATCHAPDQVSVRRARARACVCACVCTCACLCVFVWLGVFVWGADLRRPISAF